jgi:cell division protein FtsB
MFYRSRQRNGPGSGAQPEGVSRNLVKVLVGTIALAGTAALVFGERGLMDLHRARRELKEIRAQVKEKQARVSALRSEVERLETDPEALERVAREELNLAKPGEIIILLPREPGWGKPPDRSP